MDIFMLLNASEFFIDNTTGLSDKEVGEKVLEAINNLDVNQYKIEEINPDTTQVVYDSEIKDALIISFDEQE